MPSSMTRVSPTVANAIWSGTTVATPGTAHTLDSVSGGSSVVEKSVAAAELTHASACPIEANDATVESTALPVAPVTATVVTTAVSTVIMATHIRRGARSIVAAPRTPALPNSRATPAAHRMMGPDNAKQIALAPMNAKAIEARAILPRSAVTMRTVATSRMMPAMPPTIRSRLEPASDVATPHDAKASTGATPYTCRAARAEAVTLAMTAAAMAAGTT